MDKTKEQLKEEIIAFTELHPSKIRNIYIYGSRVYGTNTVNSDTDVIVTACSMHVNYEMNNGTYNVHITTPDSFEDQLRQHDIHCLECIYAPKDAQILITNNYADNFKIHVPQLKKMLLSQSAWAWSKAQRRIEKGNIIGGAKSLFHSLRILKFGIQILRHKKIVDFKEANYLWEDINGFEGIEWEEYHQKWISTKKQLMKQFRHPASTLGSMEIAINNCNTASS